MKLIKVVETYRCETEHESEKLIEDCKNNRVNGNYELLDYSSKHKIKKDEDFYLVELKKIMED